MSFYHRIEVIRQAWPATAHRALLGEMQIGYSSPRNVVQACYREIKMLLPPGFHTITPYLFVDDAPALVDFLVQAFGASEIHRSLRDDGAIANAQLAIGDSMLMISEASVAYPAMPMALYLYVDDAHASVERALLHGGVLEMAVADMPYGDRQGGVRDLAGNIWWVSQHLEDKPYDA